MATEIEVTLADGRTCGVPEGATLAEVLHLVKPPKYRQVVAAKQNGKVVDLSAPAQPGDHVAFLSFDDEEGREVFRHSSTHIMAHAVQDLFAGAKITIGPPLAEGYYYDFDYKRPFTEADLEAIEQRMQEIIAADHPFVRQEVPRQEAIALFQARGETYKVEMLEQLAEDTVSLYREGDFVDLCRGPHVRSTGQIPAVKLLSVAGAYWRGDERNPMLQRIYGTSYPSAKQVREHLQRLEEAKKRDHRLLGRQLGLFLTDERAGAGLIYWLPKGATLRKVIERFWEDEHVRRGYQLVIIPHIARDVLFRTSGHYDYYRDNMYVLEIDSDEYVLKPMNCPGHILIYQSRRHSYRELPIKFAELGTVYRYERSGALHGMLRVRGFTQDDAHIFCTPEQVHEEIDKVLQFALEMLRTFGYENFQIELSVRDPEHPEKYAGSDAEWLMAERALGAGLDKLGIPAKRQEGEAVFYGPKIDIKMLDALGRGWQGPTIQFDFNLPKRFNITYVGSDSQEHHVVMIHRTTLGSMERFIGGLTEHYAGAFPTWLAPVQAKVLTITDRHIPAAQRVLDALLAAGVRAEGDFRNEKVSLKVREAQIEQVPYMFVLGDQEMAAGSVALRHRRAGHLGVFAVDAAIARLRQVIDCRTNSEEVTANQSDRT
ncbi:MAG: threonine--tRNA ligase [Candidatus Tectomicrobia bacterium]|nr:threonine--tRNA ligase [Candidatus Tectomicrobia bacterium]